MFSFGMWFGCGRAAVFNCTAHSGFEYQYSLDGRSFRTCGPTLRLGPLASSRAHNLVLSTVSVAVGGNGVAVVSPNATFEWTVADTSASTLTLPLQSDREYSIEWEAADAALPHLTSDIVSDSCVAPEGLRGCAEWVYRTFDPGCALAWVLPPPPRLCAWVCVCSCGVRGLPSM
jgi:hypothetical protein